MAKRGMAMSATTKANIGAGRKAGLRLNSKGLGTSPFSQAKSAASKSVRKVNSEVKSKIAKAKKNGIAGKPSSPKINKESLDSTPSPDSFRMSKAKALLENTTRAKNRVNRRISNYCRLLGLIEFKKQGDSEKDKLKGSVQLAGGLGLAQQGIRSGLPRVLGVRLEQHGTSRKAAKNIIKEGYLDPGRSGSEGGVTGFTRDSNLILFTRTKGAKDKAKRKSRLRQFGEGAGIGAGLHIGSRTAFGAALYGLSSNKARADSIANNILKGNNNKYVRTTVNKVVAPVVNRTTALGIGAYRYGKGSIRNKKLLVGTTLVGGLYNLYRNRKKDVNRAD